MPTKFDNQMSKLAADEELKDLIYKIVPTRDDVYDELADFGIERIKFTCYGNAIQYENDTELIGEGESKDDFFGDSYIGDGPFSEVVKKVFGVCPLNFCGQIIIDSKLRKFGVKGDTVKYEPRHFGELKDECEEVEVD